MNETRSLLCGSVGEKSNEAVTDVRVPLITTFCVVVAVVPAPFLTVRRTTYVPVAENACVGVEPVADVPSPKVQAYAVTGPVDGDPSKNTV